MNDRVGSGRKRPTLTERTECDMIFDLGHYKNFANLSDKS